jgi:hypothetical protein
MSKVDIELAENIIIDYVKSDLAAKAAEINADKADGFLIEDVPANAYFSTFSDNINNYPLFIYYGATDVSATGIGPGTIETISMLISVHTCWNVNLNANDESWRKAPHRYTRAVKEIIESNFKEDSRITQLTIAGIVPQLFQTNENSPLYKVGGALIKGNIG